MYSIAEPTQTNEPRGAAVPDPVEESQPLGGSTVEPAMISRTSFRLSPLDIAGSTGGERTTVWIHRV